MSESENRAEHVRAQLASMRLPTVQPPAANESLQGYGVRVLAFVLDTGVTATLSDSQLELADHVYPLAIAGADILPIAVDRLSAARDRILAALRFRRSLDSEPAAIGSPVPAAAPDVAGGFKVHTVQPPDSQPPAATAAQPPAVRHVPPPAAPAAKPAARVAVEIAF